VSSLRISNDRSTYFTGTVIRELYKGLHLFRNSLLPSSSILRKTRES
jgi:hypothetical protein